MTDPRAVSQIIAEAEARLAQTAHPDPYIRASPPVLGMIFACVAVNEYWTMFNSCFVSWRNEIVSHHSVSMIRFAYYDTLRNLFHSERNIPVGV